MTANMLTSVDEPEAGHSSPSSNMPTLFLNETEKALCELLNDACHWIQSTHPQPEVIESGGIQVDYTEGWSLEARIAGGWVRDKLLGLESHDLDISLSSLTGHIFALLLRKYLLSGEFATSRLAEDTNSPFQSDSSSSQALVGHITKIAANPEQSKNLETATAKVAGLQLDFVNLRKEIYIGDSRIPTMTFGTPKEDAERRDITINTLFYNIHTRRVEDFTGLGISDLKNRIIRTPLSPQRTFLDDPLRVLRCVRFASRFDYNVHQAILDCFQGSEAKVILDALWCKVSRERFGIEVDKMIRGPNAKTSVELMFSMGLFQVIFFPPPSAKMRGKASSRGLSEVERATGLLRRLQDTIGSRHFSDANLKRVNLCGPLENEEARRLLWYSALMLPLEDMEWEEKKGKWLWAGESVIFNGLKLTGQTRKAIAKLNQARKILDSSNVQSFNRSNQDYLGKHIVELTESTLSVRATMALVMRLRCITHAEYGLDPELCLLWTAIADYAKDDGSRDWILASQPYHAILEELKETGILARVHEKILLDGKEVQEVLQIKPGKMLQIILKRVEAWQFDRDIPESSREKAKEECKEWLRQEWANGGIVPLEHRMSNGTNGSSTESKPKKKLKGGA